MITRGRFNAWPAYVDFFAGLLVVTFGVIILLYDDFAPYIEGNAVGQLQKAQKLANSIYDRLQKNQIAGVSYKRCSAEDICIDVSLEFNRDDDVILDPGAEQIGRVCTGLLQIFENPEFKDDALVRQCLQIVVEGHTDSTQPGRVADERLRYKWNWDLSARRASAVLFEMKKHGLSREGGFNVTSWGAADSDPVCTDPDPQCQQLNRRTTIRLRFDYKRYADITPDAGVSDQ